MISFLQLDRITGILIHTWGTYIDENGDRYSRTPTIRNSMKKISADYRNELSQSKYICEPHKGI